jgi:hypothetical protein
LDELRKWESEQEVFIGLKSKVQVQQSPTATVPKDLPVAQKFINQSFAVI